MSTQVSIVLEWGFLNTCTELAFLPSRVGRAVGLLRLANEVVGGGRMRCGSATSTWFKISHLIRPRAVTIAHLQEP